ncbi:MAG: histidine phosphatase family protein [Acidobacteria bacterium]|nr:histidine phosphatase family protein [Acidobacteriota bacterium]
MNNSNRVAKRTIAVVAAACLCFSLAPTGGWSGEQAEKTDGIRTVYLIRHGEYDHDDERDPDVGKGLVPLGVAQARIIGARLRGLPVEMSSLHSSTMTRARETALVIGQEFPDLELQSSRLIRECTPPTWRQDIMEHEEKADLEACTQQLEEAFPIYFAPSPDADRHDIVVCHGNVIRYFVTKVLGVDTESWLRMSIGNCSLTVVKIRADGAMKLLSFGDVGHLPPNLSTRTAPETPTDLKVPGA